jgi:hypothetical protein
MLLGNDQRKIGVWHRLQSRARVIDLTVVTAVRSFRDVCDHRCRDDL